jgi:DNA-binding transcriptional regulator PaaX
MNYNQLKLLVLRILSESPSTDSSGLAAALTAAGVNLDMHAIRMALMRYYRQGLLSRERKLGVYAYGLSERGVHRLAWLESTVRDHVSGAD